MQYQHFRRSGIKNLDYFSDDNVDPTNPDPSVVVHVRNLCPKATEADLLEALTHFGTIAYTTVMTNKRMALVEFELSSAQNCVQYAQNNPIYVAGQPALFNYSTSKMIQRIGLESEHPNSVLVLTVYNAQYPINVDVIHTICESHGQVLRIAIIRRTMLQALVEFDSVESARKAKYVLNGADIYSGCCTLKAEFGKPDHVKVTRNDQDQCDYTLPAGKWRLICYNQYPPHYGPPVGRMGYGGPGMMPGTSPGYGGPVVMVYGIDQEKWNCDKLFNLMCLYGNVLRIKFMKSKVDTAMVQMGDAQQMQAAIDFLHGTAVFDTKPSKQTSLHDIRDPFDLPDGSPSFRDYTRSRNQRFSTAEAASRNRIVRPTKVLHWFNAPGDALAPEKIVIFPMKSDRSSSGIIEFDTVEHAVEALIKCNHTPVESPCKPRCVLFVFQSSLRTDVFLVGKIPYIFKLAFASGRDGKEYRNI
ncbi:unnamed protein product [Soboliphyme baturini]|uniref:RRM domain-containing protein n=1 Tax=Soboliphyme baturini TaxID=241478 RepID=A0A183IV13_9BILA|nr:unnamed protein product [Soboliphyme baturini]